MINSLTIFDSQIMKKVFFLLKIFFVYLLLISNLSGSQENYLEKGISLFKKENFDESKIWFERDIVFNPKSEESYLYLAKIFNNKENNEEEEINLKNVLLLNPKNDEAIYMLILLKIEQSDYNYAKKLIKKFNLVCEDLCSKNNEIQDKLEKLDPDNAKTEN